MEPKMARRVNEVQASEDHPMQSGVSHSGLCADTIVLTLDGELPARDIAAGDRVITRDCGLAVVVDVIRTRVTSEVVQIKAGSLGHTRPSEDMVLPSTTKLLIRDWRAEALFGKPQALVAAKDLQDGEFVKVVAEQTLDIVELIFEKPHVVYAGGLEVACRSVG